VNKIGPILAVFFGSVTPCVSPPPLPSIFWLYGNILNAYIPNDDISKVVLLNEAILKVVLPNEDIANVG
jgi:hypothetical protein